MNFILECICLTGEISICKNFHSEYVDDFKKHKQELATHEF
jgi:hypothetical protein